ncbi:peptidyl-prolyl cis-trans isomerase [Snodgrassella sp. B3882]|uniref:peptidylprolyl isomerase n=1 Tax=Snodgrassella sp. B3882 TaxID=2818037 RepID=UPI00226A9F06|nr:SurA N-terminal domain-containing protein [Snodgrassella sp. B3882]MCX8744131.1 peptidyl-prolyl cis-trans isomerase [Snodgrassella sp. B3882]
MKKHLIAATLMLSLTGLASAHTLVTVNGTKIDSKEVDSQVALLIKESNNQIQDSQQLRDDITNRLVMRTLLIQEAKKQKLDKNPQYLDLLKQAENKAKQLGDDKKPNFKTQWAIFKDDLLTQAYLVNVAQSIPVQPEEVKSAYNDLVQNYAGVKEVQLGEIILQDKNSAQKAIADLNAKKNFSSVAKQYTIDEAGRQKGGISNSYINLKDLQDSAGPVYNAIKNLKKGQYTATPVQIQPNQNIYVIFYVNDIRAVKIPSEAEIAPALTRRLQNTKVNAFLQQLVDQANIQK